MSNIKFIFQKKVHKLPQSVNSFSAVVNTIKTVYKQLDTIYLYAVINPDSIDGVAEINSDVAFKQLKQLYTQLGWPSIKLLVTQDPNAESIIKDSWGLLNQSQIFVEKKSHDVGTLFQPIQTDQQQQIAPKADNQSTQVKVQQSDNAQNTSPVDFRNNEQLKQLIIKIVDERLQYYGLIGNKKGSEKDQYKFSLQTKRPIYQAQPGQKLQIPFDFKNSGTEVWNNAFMICKQLNISKPLKNVSPGQSCSVSVEISCQFQKSQKEIFEFQIICENEKQEFKQVEGTIPITIQKVKMLDYDEQKVEQLLQVFPQKGRNFLVNFVKNEGKNKQFEELVEQLLLQQF